MTAVEVGVLSLGGSRDRLASGTDRRALLTEARLVNSLVAAGHRVIAASTAYPDEDRLATGGSLMRQHARTLIDYRPAVYLLHLVGAAPAAAVVEAARFIESRLGARGRFLVFADAREAGPEALMAAAGALRRLGYGPAVVFGDPDTPDGSAQLAGHVAFGRARREQAEVADQVAAALSRSPYLAFGPALGVDPDRAMKAFGVRVEPGPVLSTAGHDADPRLAAAKEESDAPAEVLSLYLAAADAIHEAEARFAAFGDGIDARVPTWLSDDRGPDGRAKDMIPASSSLDFETALAQLVLARGAGRPAFQVAAAAVVGEGPFTLARFGWEDTRPVLHVREGEGAGAAARWGDLIQVWPSSHGARADGHHAPFLAELADRLGVGLRLVDHAGRRYERIS